MKKPIRLILWIAAVLLFAISCDSKTGKIHNHSEAQQTDEHQQEESATQQINKDEQAGKEDLELNNGNLWEANLETTKGIDNMKLLIKSFSERDNMNTYPRVKENLEKEFRTIIAKCTMTGEVHDQLHKYLVPFQISQATQDTVPLLGIRINLEKNLAVVQAGIWRGNYQIISEAANAMVNHGYIPHREIQKIETILGKEGFKKFRSRR